LTRADSIDRGARTALDWSIFEVVDLELRADDQKLLGHASSVYAEFTRVVCLLVKW
jgi:hypothetical protein